MNNPISPRTHLKAYFIVIVGTIFLALLAITIFGVINENANKVPLNTAENHQTWYDEGLKAGLNGQNFLECPYSTNYNSSEVIWKRGWERGRIHYIIKTQTK